MKKRRCIVAITLIIAMVMSMFPVVGSAETLSDGDSGTVGSKLASYRFESADEDGKIADLSGMQNDAVISGDVTVGGGNATLAGGYIELPDGIADGLSGITISGWFKRNAKQYDTMLFSLGHGTNKYLGSCALTAWGQAYATVTGNSAANQTQALYGTKTSKAWTGESPITTFAAGEWTYITLTWGDGKISLYANGELLAQSDTPYELSIMDGATENYLGKSPFSADPNFLGLMSCVDIYGKVLSAEEIQSEMNITNVICLIYAIGDVTLDSGDAIQAARDAFDALPEEDQAKVSDYQTLLDAEKAYADLLKAEEVPVIAEGYTGDLTWKLDETGKLTFEVINEVGKMKKYVAKNEVPWVEYMNQITSVEIPEGVTRISAYTFYGATNLTSVVVPSTVTEISEYAFKNSGLTSVTLANGLVTIGDSAFYGTGITEIVIPETVETVGEYAFARSGLTEVTFTGDAPTIGEGAFNKIAVTASYPAGNETWTEDVLQNYGGTVTWTAK